MMTDRGGSEGTEIDQLTSRIIECIIAVHTQLGPGFDESIYQNAMVIEAKKRGLTFETEYPVTVYYDSQIVGKHRIDMIFEGRVIVELKAVEQLAKKHLLAVAGISQGN